MFMDSLTSAIFFFWSFRKVIDVKNKSTTSIIRNLGEWDHSSKLINHDSIERNLKQIATPTNESMNQT